MLSPWTSGPDAHLRRTARAALFALALAALPLGAAGAASAARAKNGVIAYVARQAGTPVVFTRRANGTRLRAPLGRDGSDQPAFSPQGRRLAFRRFSELGAQIWVSYPGGVGLRQLTAGPRDGEPTWSPPGDALAFARGRRRHRHIYVIRADGGRLRRLTKSARDDRSPAWSRRKVIAFVRRNARNNDDIYAIRPSGGPARRLTHSRRRDADPAWSPTGRTLAFARGRPGHRDIYLLTANGAHRRLVVRLHGDESEPVWSPDGRRIAFTYRRGSRRWVYLVKLRRRPLTRLSSRFRRLTSSRSAARSQSWQTTGFDPVIAAAGDIACDPASKYFNGGLGIPGVCRQRYTSDLLMRMDLTRVLVLGDAQYEDGTLDKFRRSFGPSWGRLEPLISPVPGNHEYRSSSAAAGYFDYFNGPGAQAGPAGERGKGYYSFDIGSWHVLTLNSECSKIGGCDASSPQGRWIRADLAAHPAVCTMALFHRPLFTSGEFGTSAVRPLWDALYQGGADLILNGHDHVYERFAPQTPTGGYDPVRGIRELLVGTGGASHHSFVTVAPNSQFQDEGTFGVLRLVLRRGRYDWRQVTASSGTVLDSGSTRCH
ncbi:MAG: metallophosphoesterase [Thermoleophilaceae bacterium]